MKQNALVIATLMATAQADRNIDDAKARLERDIRGYLHQGLKFDTKAINALHKHAVKQAKAENKFKEEMRDNFVEGIEVGDEYIDAMAYERSQEVITPPSAANGNWGNIHYNNPQEIVDRYMDAADDARELGREYRHDIREYSHKIQKNNNKLNEKLAEDWEKHGEKAQAHFNAAVGQIGQAWKEADVNAPQNLAINAEELRQDTRQFTDSVGAAANAVRNTINGEARAQHRVDRQIDRTNFEYLKRREEIAKGYNRAIEFEIKNLHLDRGLPGGEGKFWVTNPQAVANHWKRPIEANERANQVWQAQLEREMAEKQRIHAQWKAEAEKVWPAKFQAVQKSWGELAANFQENPQSLAWTAQEKAEVKSSLRNMVNKAADLDETVVRDVVNYNNSICDQQCALKKDVETYIKEKQAINAEYAEAWNYEMENVHFEKNANGDWQVIVDNREQILDNWDDAFYQDIEAREQLKDDFIEYERSIAAQKAAFRRTARATWPQKFQAYQKAVIEFDESLHGPEDRAQFQQRVAPQSLITDVQQREAELIRAQVYDNINDRLEFKWQVRRDIRDYMRNTHNARAQLKQEAKDWKVAARRVQDMYAAAWNYQIANTKFTRANAQHPAHIELENPVQVSNNFRAAAQADQNLGQEIVGDIQNYNRQIQPAKAELAREINGKWIPEAEAINRSDVAIFEEVVNFPTRHANATFDALRGNVTEQINAHNISRPNFTHPYANQTYSLMSIHETSSLSTNQQLAFGSCFLLAMIATAHLLNKNNKSSKTIEFDVEDLEMTNKRESKKQIKKTLKDIMKTSNTKVTLMNH